VIITVVGAAGSRRPGCPREPLAPLSSLLLMGVTLYVTQVEVNDSCAE
jgi:hypothetical protein